MTTKEYLSQLKKLDKEINELTKDEAMWRDRASSLGQQLSDMDRVQGTPVYDRMAEEISNAITCEKECAKKLEVYDSIRRKIEEQLCGIHDRMHFGILVALYVRGKNIRQTSVEIGHEIRYTKRLHRSALMEFEKLYGEYYL